MTKNENLLVTLMEECAELQQAVSKALRFGMDGCPPSDPEKTNEQNIMTEYYQLVTVMEMLVDSGVLHSFSPADRALVKSTKKINVMRYQEVSEAIGQIKDCAKDSLTVIQKGSPIWYVDFEIGKIEEGEVFSVYYKNGHIDVFSVEFKDTGDFDEFVGSALGNCFFTSREVAEQALVSGHGMKG